MSSISPQQCIFCQVAAHKTPAEIEYEDDDVVAFWDVNKKAPVHILIIPKHHIESVHDLTIEHAKVIGHMILVAKDLAIKKNIAENGYRLVFNVGRNGGQIVEHLHLHLLGGKKLGPIA